MLYFTADTHFGHANIMRYCQRPFSSVDEMDEAMFVNFASVLRPEDELFHLGDFAFGDIADVRAYVDRFAKLPGRKYFIPGNHDRYRDVLRGAFEILPPLYSTDIAWKRGRCRCELCHYPLLEWKGFYRQAIQLYGHVHGRAGSRNRQLDVGVDCWNFFPASAEQIMEKLKHRKNEGVGDDDEQ